MAEITIQVPNELFLTHNGVNIYNTYKRNNYNDRAYTNFFTTDPYGSEQDDDCFDIRELDNWEPQDPDIHSESHYKDVLMKAIDGGVFEGIDKEVNQLLETENFLDQIYMVIDEAHKGILYIQDIEKAFHQVKEKIAEILKGKIIYEE